MPSHASHAPYGELNEKLRGASSSNDSPQCVHARCSENVSVSAASLSLLGHDLDLGDALRELERRLQRVGEAALDPGAPDQPVDDDLDRVLLVPFELELGGQVDELTVDPGARVALARELVEQRVVLALAPAHDRREHLEAGAVLQRAARGRRSAAGSGG